MEEGILATVNINIGMGRDNPCLIIREGDHIPTLVHRLIDNYQLPKKSYAIIMGRVEQQIKPTNPMHSKDPLLKTSKIQKQTSLSGVKSGKTFMSKLNGNRSGAVGKENIKNNCNLTLNQSKNMSKKSLSPVCKNTTTPLTKKIELKANKSPARANYSSTKTSGRTIKRGQGSARIQKLFKFLTKCNPANVDVLTPEHINLKGMDRNLLSHLQQFFERLQQEQFELMGEKYFLERVEEMGFTSRLGKKEYEYCYSQ